MTTVTHYCPGKPIFGGSAATTIPSIPVPLVESPEILLTIET